MTVDASKTADKYTRDVISGRIVACKWTRLACRRHIDDIKRWGRRPRADRPYWFDRSAAQHAVDFFLTCRHVKGALAGRRLDLEPWQVFFVASLFGWQTPEGLRRFTRGYLEVGRKNGKSTMLAAIGLYLLEADGESGAEVYSAATTFKQASLVFQIARRMVRVSPILKNEIQSFAHTLFVDENFSKFEPLHAKSDSNEGLDVHGALVDELHAHRTPEMWDVLIDGMAARREPLIIAITTAGNNRAGVCYEQRDYVCKILEGVLEDDRYFGIVYTLDKEEEWKDPAMHIKANPNIGDERVGGGAGGLLQHGGVGSLRKPGSAARGLRRREVHRVP